RAISKRSFLKISSTRFPGSRSPPEFALRVSPPTSTKPLLTHESVLPLPFHACEPFYARRTVASTRRRRSRRFPDRCWSSRSNREWISYHCAVSATNSATLELRFPSAPGPLILITSARTHEIFSITMRWAIPTSSCLLPSIMFSFAVTKYQSALQSSAVAPTCISLTRASRSSAAEPLPEASPILSRQPRLSTSTTINSTLYRQGSIFHSHGEAGHP